MKVLQKIIISLILSFGFFGGITITHAAVLEVGQMQSISDKNLQTGENKSNNIKQEKLDKLNQNSDSKIKTTSNSGSIGIKNTFIKIAKDVKNVFFYIASLYFLVLIYKLYFSEKTEEGSSNLKKGGIWVSLGLVVTQGAYAFVMVLFDQGVSENLAYNFGIRIIDPIISILEISASFLFISIAIFAFYKLVTANGDDESVKSGKMSVIYAIIGFIVIKVTKAIVNALYGKVDCRESSLSDILQSSFKDRAKCLGETKLSDSAQTIVDIINWANGFIGIIVVLLIIYTGIKVLISAGDEDTLKKAKSSIIYIALGLLLLVMNYLILTFFIIPEVPIV